MAQLPFRDCFRGLYGPARLQECDTGKHFVRRCKGKSGILKTCGVSYIKPTESQQANPLPPLIFQCSSECDKGPSDHLEGLARHLYRQDMIVVECKEADMRSLLLNRPRGRVGVGSIRRAWEVIENESFLLFVPDAWGTEEQMWQRALACPVRIGLLTKKGICSRKSVF
jgi:hypothetical protein